MTDNLESDPRFNEIPEWAQRDLQDVPVSGMMGEDEWHEVGFLMQGGTECQVAVINRKWVVLDKDLINRIDRIAYVFTEDGKLQEVRHNFCDNCPGCRPAIIQGGQPLSDEHPVMKAVLQVWETDTTYEERKAYFGLTSGYELSKADNDLAGAVVVKMRMAIEKIHETLGREMKRLAKGPA